MQPHATHEQETDAAALATDGTVGLGAPPWCGQLRKRAAPCRGHDPRAAVKNVGCFSDPDGSSHDREDSHEPEIVDDDRG